MGLFSKNLRFLRKQRQLNQDEIARLFSKRANTIGNWENEKSEPNLSELVKLGNYFNISLHELLHTDLESEGAPVSFSRGLQEKQPTEYKIQEPARNIANDEGGDSFGPILRELKIVQEKLDKISSTLISVGVGHSIDKSNH